MKKLSLEELKTKVSDIISIEVMDKITGGRDPNSLGNQEYSPGSNDIVAVTA